MKAASAILVQSQRQMRVLGIALPLMVLIAGSVAAFSAVLIVLDLVALVLPAAAALFLGLWYAAFRASRTNPFLDRDLFLAGRFWTGKGARRHLIAGGRA